MSYLETLHSLIDRTIKEGASDLHLSVDRNPTLRVSGKLLPLTSHEKLTPDDTEGISSVLIPERLQEKFVETKEVDFSYEKDDHRFRCNCFIQQGSVGIAMRYIPANIRSLTELKLPAVLAEFAMREQGFFLVVGPVGQGKTTTLASMVEEVNKARPVHVTTIEDPVEYVFEQKQAIIDQREVGTDTTSFEAALKNLFRQDVDVVLVGEMRGSETIETAVTAAETGHLVLSTLHTNDAPQTIDRIIDSFPSNQQPQIRSQLAASLMGIFSQRLVPAVSGGVIPVYELLLNNTAVSNLIRESRVHEINAVIDTSLKEGMISMNHSLIERVHAGDITLENAQRFSTDPDTLKRLI